MSSSFWIGFEKRSEDSHSWKKPLLAVASLAGLGVGAYATRKRWLPALQGHHDAKPVSHLAWVQHPNNVDPDRGYDFLTKQFRRSHSAKAAELVSGAAKAKPLTPFLHDGSWNTFTHHPMAAKDTRGRGTAAAIGIKWDKRPSRQAIEKHTSGNGAEVEKHYNNLVTDPNYEV